MGQEESLPLVDDDVAPHSLTDRSLSAVAEYIKDGSAKRIVVLTGAGISTAAGIPDFRSPKTGLYSNLARLNLPYAEAVFDISYFRNKPEPFYVLAKELYPGKFYPTVSHAFIALLAKKELLHMLFTQNIDCLERRAGVPADKIIEAHGSFASQRCIECKKEYPDEDMKAHVFEGKVPHCKDGDCNGLVKPDIVFFGEQLPKAFDHNSYQTSLADLVLIIGTSLSVYPFAGLPELTNHGKPRVLFNMERVGKLGMRPDDVIELGACDDGIRRLADELGWRDELEELWRGVVGDKEAERQLRSQASHDQEVDEEVQKLALEVDSALRLDDDEVKKDIPADLVEQIRGHLEGRIDFSERLKKGEEAEGGDLKEASRDTATAESIIKEVLTQAEKVPKKVEEQLTTTEGKPPSVEGKPPTSEDKIPSIEGMPSSEPKAKHLEVQEEKAANPGGGASAATDENDDDDVIGKVLA